MNDNALEKSAKVNQKTWLKVERYGRSLAVKLRSIHSISIADYKGATKTIKNGIVIPSGFYRIYYNNNTDFEKCFYYRNTLNVDYKRDKLKNHLIDCATIKRTSND